MTRWPWITAVGAAVLAMTPIVHEIFNAAFVSSERWMQDFWQFVFLCGVVIMAVLAFIEWGIRAIVVRRRAAAIGAAGPQNTET